jgi:hypothetical protein
MGVCVAVDITMVTWRTIGVYASSVTFRSRSCRLYFNTLAISSFFAAISLRLSSNEMPTNNNQDNLYVDNLLRHLATQHPIFWSRKDLSLMGIPDILPTVPIPPTDISGLSFTEEAFEDVRVLDEAAAEKKRPHPYSELRSLVVAIADWFGECRGMTIMTNSLHPLLKLGELRYRLKPVCLISCVNIPCIVYLDAPLREYYRGTYRGRIIQDFLKLSALGQSDDTLEPFDFGMLIALAQEQKFFEVQPDVDGSYTVCHPVS